MAPSCSSPTPPSNARSTTSRTASGIEEALCDRAPRWQRYWPGADVKAILADVRARLTAAVEAWDLASPQPLSGGVGALTCAAGEVVVKVLPRHHPEEHLMHGEAEALGHWRSTGAAVELLDRRDDGMTLLLRRIRPATALDDLPYDEQLVIAGRLVARLHAAGAPPAGLPSIEAYVEQYRFMNDAELDALLASSPAPVAVHADLHGGNVLRDGDAWVAIDPKGVSGDPHLDIWALTCAQAPPLSEEDPASEMRRRIDLYANAAGLDPERAAAWVRVVARAEAELLGNSAFEGWTERLRRFAAALSSG